MARRVGLPLATLLPLLRATRPSKPTDKFIVRATAGPRKLASAWLAEKLTPCSSMPKEMPWAKLTGPLRVRVLAKPRPLPLYPAVADAVPEPSPPEPAEALEKASLAKLTSAANSSKARAATGRRSRLLNQSMDVLHVIVITFRSRESLLTKS